MKTISNKSKSGLQRQSAHRSEGTENKNQLPKIDLKRRQQNRNLPTQEFLHVLKTEAPEFFEQVEVIGRWCWITFPDKQPSKVTRVLAELGFHWCNRRLAWANPCQIFTLPSKRDPRERYNHYFPADLNRA